MLVASSRPPIPTSSTASLHLRLGKVDQRQRRQNLEEARKLRQPAIGQQPLRQIVNAKKEPREILVRNLRLSNADALIHPRQVRRRVEARAHP